MLLLLPILIGTTLAAPSVQEPLGPGVSFAMRDQKAATITTEAVSKPDFWTTSNVLDYENRDYDQVRLRPMETGFFSMITGEGQQADGSHGGGAVVGGGQQMLRVDGA